MIIEEAALTGQKDETYSQYLDKQKTKLMKYEEEIDEVRLKININKHRQLIEQTQPTVKEGLDQLKKESGINTDESVEIEDPEKESDYTHINEETPFEESQKTVIKKSEKSEDKETIVKKDSGDKVQNFDHQTISSKSSSSIWKIGVGVIIQTSIIISLIYFSSNNYILSRDLNHLLPIQEKKLSLITEKNELDTKIERTLEITYGLRNFIGNAIKYGKSSVDITLESNNKNTQVKICDDGPGFSEDITDFLGEPYIRSKNKIISSKSGLGLGTFIGKTLLERMKANVSFGKCPKTNGALVIIKWQTKELKAT